MFKLLCLSAIFLIGDTAVIENYEEGTDGETDVTFTSYEEDRTQDDTRFWIDAMDRIINGNVVDIAEYPYQVALIQTNRNNDKKRIICGGVLVGPRTVFTAAHCTHVTDFRKRPNLSVLVGANSLKDPNGKEHAIDKAVKHPYFSFSGLDHDFSVIVLDEPVQYSERVKTIQVSEDRHRGGTTASVSGWGQTEFGVPSKKLRATELTVEKWENCQNYFPKISHPRITRNMICVRPSETTTYYGDSGGPLTIDGKLVGLVSFGRTVSGDRKTTVFTRVKNFLNFAGKVSPDFGGPIKNDDDDDDE